MDIQTGDLLVLKGPRKDMIYATVVKATDINYGATRRCHVLINLYEMGAHIFVSNPILTGNSFHTAYLFSFSNREQRPGAPWGDHKIIEIIKGPTCTSTNLK